MSVQLRKWQSIGASENDRKSPLLVGASAIFIGEILDLVVGRDRPRIGRRSWPTYQTWHMAYQKRTCSFGYTGKS